MDRTQPLVRLYTVKLLANTWVAEDAAGGLWIVHNNAGGWDSRTPYRGQPLEHYEQHIDPALQARVWGQTWGWPLADESLSMPQLRCQRCDYVWTPRQPRPPML